MPAVNLTLAITVDGQPIIEFPVVRRTESPAAATGEITDRLTTAATAIDAGSVGNLTVFFLQALDGAVTLGLNGALTSAAAAPILNPRGMMLLYLCSINEGVTQTAKAAVDGTTVLQQMAGATPGFS